jgi:phosphoribosylformylglycinamidine cyclo-ligase
MSDGLTYRGAGVDVGAADRLVARIAGIAAATHGPEVEPGPAAFAGLYRLPGGSLLAATCDGVGTKLLIARHAGDFEGIGRDLVAMNVNDLLPVGARPLFFLDYVAAGSLDPGPIAAVVAGAAAACGESGCALLGGETAEMPGLYRPGDLDVAGFAVGLVDPHRRPDPDGPRAGDRVMALPSSGIHANGLSLARTALLDRAGLQLDEHVPELGRTLAEELLEPTALYVEPVLAAPPGRVGALAHVTGGGLAGRGRAMLPEGLRMRLDPQRWRRPPVFDLIERAGPVTATEMAATFNLGLGFLAVVEPDAAAAWEQDGWLPVGEIRPGERGVSFDG